MLTAILVGAGSPTIWDIERQSVDVLPALKGTGILNITI
jgi:hypothetical protein